ncbi:MAG: RecX family transcriptional regulator [Lentimicrobiaceae bacterium]|nr:RecX family transcriptional regulator [Lentimicrobiaceae bacterium]MCO5265179.1 RecX family transcriptional regulator [Lentimicrobium sp.]HPG32724.1 regulatory protein RecX [Lentimicrobium sp.]
MKEFQKQLAKLRRWCAMQERCLVEVRIHSQASGISEENSEKIISHLQEEGFIDEERYAKLYAGGKFRNKKWGRARIIGELKARQISDDKIKIGLSEIDEEEYRRVIVSMVEHKISVTDRSNMMLFKHRLAKPAVAKGYEPELVMQIIDELVKMKEA